MKKGVITLLLLLPIIFFKANGATPTHIGKLNIDTSMYDFSSFRSTPFFLPGPFTEYMSSLGSVLKAFLKKNSTQFDIYSLNGKIGSSVVPIIKENVSIIKITYSCYMVDDDDEWETLVTFFIEEPNNCYFKVFDNDGTELLADSGSAAYACDNNNTYIINGSTIEGFLDYDIWRFRTNISTTTSKSLSKTRAAKPSFMQIYGLSDGNYKVSLIPSSGNQVQFQMFDLMGRCIFSKQLENLKAPVTFTIPESNVPNSPFIAKVKDGNETLYKKQIPLR